MHPYIYEVALTSLIMLSPFILYLVGYLVGKLFFYGYANMWVNKKHFTNSEELHEGFLKYFSWYLILAVITSPLAIIYAIIYYIVKSIDIYLLLHMYMYLAILLVGYIIYTLFYRNKTLKDLKEEIEGEKKERKRKIMEAKKKSEQKAMQRKINAEKRAIQRKIKEEQELIQKKLREEQEEIKAERNRIRNRIKRDINELKSSNSTLNRHISPLATKLSQIEEQESKITSMTSDASKIVKTTKNTLQTKLNSFNKIKNSNDARITYLTDKLEEYNLMLMIKDMDMDEKVKELDAEIDKFTYLNVKSELMEEYTYNDAMIELVAKIEATQDNEELNRLVGELNGILREFNSRG